MPRKYTWDVDTQSWRLPTPLEQLNTGAVYAELRCVILQPGMRFNGTTLETMHDSSNLKGAERDAMDAEYARIVLAGVVYIGSHVEVTYPYMSGVFGNGSEITMIIQHALEDAAATSALDDLGVQIYGLKR